MQYLRDNAGVLEASANGTTWQPVALGSGGSGNGLTRVFITANTLQAADILNHGTIFISVINAVTLPTTPADPDYSLFWLMNKTSADLLLSIQITDIFWFNAVAGNDGQGLTLGAAASCLIYGMGSEWVVISHSGPVALTV